MGILVDIILTAAIVGYAFYLIQKIVRSMMAGKGNPYGCSGDCSSCGGGCSRSGGACSSVPSGKSKAERK